MAVKKLKKTTTKIGKTTEKKTSMKMMKKETEKSIKIIATLDLQLYM